MCSQYVTLLVIVALSVVLSLQTMGIPVSIHTLRHMLPIMTNVWHITTSKASVFVAEIVRIPRGYATPCGML